jgi:hypothetical protein
LSRTLDSAIAKNIAGWIQRIHLGCAIEPDISDTV